MEDPNILLRYTLLCRDSKWWFKWEAISENLAKMIFPEEESVDFIEEFPLQYTDAIRKYIIKDPLLTFDIHWCEDEEVNNRNKDFKNNLTKEKPQWFREIFKLYRKYTRNAATNPSETLNFDNSSNISSLMLQSRPVEAEQDNVNRILQFDTQAVQDTQDFKDALEKLRNFKV